LTISVRDALVVAMLAGCRTVLSQTPFFVPFSLLSCGRMRNSTRGGPTYDPIIHGAPDGGGRVIHNIRFEPGPNNVNAT